MLSRRTLRKLAPLSALPLLALACGGEAPPPPSTPPVVPSFASAAPAASASAPATASASPGVDESALDPSVSPCDDFYAYACGTWIKNTPIPDDEAAWMRSFNVIRERNEAMLRDILEEDAKAPGKDAYAKQLGDFYASCMDEKGIEANGDKALKAQLAKIDAVKDAKSLGLVLAALHGQGVGGLFDFSSGQDFKDATQVIGIAEQGGLGLPDRDYYLKDDAKSKDLRDKYLAHVEKMLTLAGDKPEQAKAGAKVVMKIETALARASMTKVDLRDPKKIYHRLEIAGLKQLAPQFPWDEYLKALGFPGVTAINVAQPDFFKEVGAQMAALKGAAKASEWKTYLRWHLVHGTARALPSRFVDEDFRFRSALTGAAKNLPRWKRCVRAVDAGMGEALAQPFVAKTLGAEGKATTEAMIAGIEASMKDNLEHLAWMDQATREKALAKLKMIRNKVGYPDTWRNYDAMKIERGSYLDNLLAADAFEVRRQLAKIGKPLDRKEWQMTPPTVNAYYDPSLNEMVFPAGILQPPFYSNAAGTGVNFGGIGMVMGHELTHGFDDEGRQFDGDGNLKDWWSPGVGKEFDARAACVAKQYDGFVAVDDVHVNGKLTLGENIADLGGVKLAYATLERTLKEHPAGKEGKGQKFTPEQQFFLGYAQGWCGSYRPEMLRLLVSTNPHSPPRFRVMGPLSNMPEFAKAFSCKEGSKMVRPKADRCEVW